MPSEQPQEEAAAPKDPQVMITVRMPKSLREKLKAQAKVSQVSLNALCLSSLTGDWLRSHEL